MPAKLTEEELRHLIKGGETIKVELKLAPPRPTELAQRMCGMANAHGGYIIIGVEDGTLKIIGVSDTGAAVDTLLRAARQVDPPLILSPIEPEIFLLDSVPVVVATVLPSFGPIYQASGVHWIRRGSNTVPLSTDQLFELGNDRGLISWERQVIPIATMKDLDIERVEAYLNQRTLRRRQSTRYDNLTEVLVGMGCAVPAADGEIRPTNAGLLFFGIDPQLYLPQSEVVCVIYRDEVGAGRYADRKILTGTMQELIDSTEAFLSLHVPVPAEIIGWKREDYPTYSIEALREAVINAVVHRDYSKTGESIRIFYYSNRIEVHNPGQLLPGITIEQMERGEVVSKLRNQVLANLLRDIPGYMERIGSGIRFMILETQRLGIPRPQFKEQYEFVVTFYQDETPQVSFPPEKREPEITKVIPDPILIQETPLEAEQRKVMAMKYVQQHGFITNRQYRVLTGISEATALRDLEALVLGGALKSMGTTRSRRYQLP